MRTYIFLAIFLNIVYGCSNEQTKIISEVSPTSSDRTNSQEGVLIVGDAYSVIDNKVEEIKAQIISGVLVERKLDRMSNLGGTVFELLDNNQSLVYFHSRGGGELGSMELECFYNNESLIYVICRKYVHQKDNNSIISWDNSQLVFEENNYIIDSVVSKRNLIQFDENEVWKKSDLPSENELLEIIYSIELEMKQWIK